MPIESQKSLENRIVVKVVDETLKKSVENFDDKNMYQSVRVFQGDTLVLYLDFSHNTETRQIYIKNIYKSPDFRLQKISLDFLIAAYESLYEYANNNDVTILRSVVENPVLRKLYYRLRSQDRIRHGIPLTIKERVIQRLNNIYPIIPETWTLQELQQRIIFLKKLPKKREAEGR